MKKLLLAVIGAIFLLFSAISVTALFQTIILNGPLDYYNTSAANINFNFTVINSSDTLSTCNLTINGVVNISNILATNGTPQINTTNGFNDGSYHWNITCWNGSNNMNISVTRIFVVDTLAPTTSLNGTSAKSLNAGQTVYIWANWADATTGVKNIELIVSGLVNKTNTTGLAAGSEATYNFSYTTSTSQIGSTLNFTINATDYAGNENSTSLLQIAVVDGLPPNVILISPIDGHNSSNTNVTLQFNITDNYASTVYCNIMVDGVVNTTQNDDTITDGVYETLNSVITGLSDTAHYWNVTCWDFDNNTNTSATRKFSIDTIPPIISNLRNTSTTSENSHIEFDCNENCNYSILWYDSAGLVGSLNNNTFATSHKPYLSSLINSITYFVNLTVWDVVGNSATNKTFNFTTAKAVTLDTTPPTINLDAPLNLTSNFTLLFANFSDDGSLGGIITLNELSDNFKEKNITFNSDETQTAYLNLPKNANISSATLDLKGYNYSDYVYYSFENEVYNSREEKLGKGWTNLFGHISGVGTFNPHVIIKTVPIDFTFNKLKLFYKRDNGDDISFHYKIRMCRVDNTNTCLNTLTTIVDDFNVYDYVNQTQDITLDNTYELIKGERYKITFTCIGSCIGIIYPSTYFVGKVGDSDGELFDDNIAVLPSTGTLLKLKLFPVPENPKSPSIDVGNNSIFEWSYSGNLLNTTTASNLTTATNDYLSTCEADSNGYCSVPLVFDTQSIGIIEASNINVKHSGNNSCEVCIASDGKCDTEWTINNVTDTYSTDYLSGNCSYSWNASNYNDGIYNVSIRIKDTAYNTGTSSKKITIDRTTPIFLEVRPSDNGAFTVNNSNPANITNSSFGLIFWYLVNDLSSITNCSLIFNDKINNTAISIKKYNYFNKFNLNITTTISSTQYYNWSITCTDAFGHEGSTETKKFTVIIMSNFSGETTDLGAVNLSKIENLTFEQTDSGKIKFSGIVNLSGIDDINRHVKLSFNRIEINSSAFPALNKSATLYIYNLTYNTTPKILRDNVTCPETICRIINYSDGTLIFNVTQFSAYTTEETPVDSGSSGSESSGSSGGSSSGGGSGGGGGGGVAAGYVCNMDWQCGDWSVCIDGTQTRQCDFVKVSQHWQETSCPDETKSPPDSQKCEITEQKSTIPAKPAELEKKRQSATTSSVSTTSSQTNESLSAITGGAITSLLPNRKALKELIIGFVVLGIVIVGIIVYKFVYKRK